MGLHDVARGSLCATSSSCACVFCYRVSVHFKIKETKEGVSDGRQICPGKHCNEVRTRAGFFAFNQLTLYALLADAK